MPNVATVNDHLDRLGSLLDRLLLVVKGLQFAASGFAVTAIVGGLFAFAGFVRAGWAWWLGLMVGVILAVPALVLWQFRSRLEAALAIPDGVRALPTGLSEAQDDLGPLTAALAGIIDKPTSPRAFIQSIRGTKTALEAFNDSSVGRLVGGVTVLHPAGLLAGGTASLFAVGALFVGVAIFVVAGLF
mgnify:CR=1 FL=1